MLLVCGLANAADAVEILSVGLLGPAAEHDLQLTSKLEGALNASIFMGMFLGGISWGYLSDTFGKADGHNLSAHSTLDALTLIDTVDNDR